MKTKKELKAPEYMPESKPKSKKTLLRDPATNQQKRLKSHRRKSSAKKAPKAHAV